MSHKVCSIGHLPFGTACSLCGSHSGPVVLKWEWVYEGGCASWWLWGLVAPGLGRLKLDTTGSSHGDRPASDFSTFPLVIYIGVKVQSDTHFSSKRYFPSNILLPETTWDWCRNFYSGHKMGEVCTYTKHDLVCGFTMVPGIDSNVFTIATTCRSHSGLLGPVFTVWSHHFSHIQVCKQAEEVTKIIVCMPMHHHVCSCPNQCRRG